MERTPAALAKMIDHTLLKPNITNEEMNRRATWPALTASNPWP